MCRGVDDPGEVIIAVRLARKAREQRLPDGELRLGKLEDAMSETARRYRGS